MLNIRISPKCSESTVNMLYASLCRSCQPKEPNPFEGLEECRKNVVRANNSRKLQYCKAH